MSEIIKKEEEVYYTDLLSFVKNELQVQTIRKDCKLCNSKHRDAANALFEEKKSIQGVCNFLKEKGDEISYPAVRKHLNNHASIQENDVNIKDLAERLAKWDKLDTSDTVLLNRYIKLFDIEINDLMGDRSCGPIERRKNVELASKLSTQIGVFKQQLKDISKEKKPVEVVFTNLHRIISLKIEDTKNPEVKRVLADIFEQISKDFGDMPLDGYKEED